MQTGKLIPFGYLAPGASVRLDRLMEDEQTLLVDIRDTPWSKRPEWQQQALENRYGNHQRERAGRYHSIGELGNKNHQSRDVLPIAIRNPTRGLAVLWALLAQHNVVLLCACPRYDGCHRKVVVELLLEQYPDSEVIVDGVQVAPVTRQETLWQAPK